MPPNEIPDETDGEQPMGQTTLVRWLRQRTPCRACDGIGVWFSPDARTCQPCPSCRGSGHVLAHVPQAVTTDD